MYKDKNHFSLLVRKRDGKKIYYYYCYDEDGKRVKRSTGATSKARALDVISKRIEAGTLLMTEQVSRADISRHVDAGVYFSQFYSDKCPICDMLELRGKPLGDDKRREYRGTVAKWIEPFFAGKDISKITPNDLRAWQKHALDSGLKSTTVNAYYGFLDKMLAYAVDDGILESNPSDKVKSLYGEKTRFDAFTPAEIEALFSREWNNDIAYLGCRIAATSGMRNGELRALRFGAVKNGLICIKANARPDGKIKSTKNGKDRYCPIPPELELEIRNMQAIRCAGDDDFVFSMNNANPVSVSFFNENLHKQQVLCGLDESKSMHSFRHFFNSMLVSGGVNGELLRSIIGHQSKAMTDHYLHVEITDMSGISAVQQKILEKHTTA